MIVERFTCRHRHDADLAGIPASIYAVDAESHEYILVFDEGSKLRIPMTELVRLKWEDSKC